MLASVVGGLLGILVTLSIIAGFEEMILSSIFNLYYASVFFIVGSYYTYKIIKKNQIQMSLENETIMASPGLPSKGLNINGFAGKDEFKDSCTGGSASKQYTLGGGYAGADSGCQRDSCSSTGLFS